MPDKNLALFRIIQLPFRIEKPRPCDVQVSSDGGRTWATIPTTNTKWVGSDITLTLNQQMSH